MATVRVWDRETGKQIGEPYAGHNGRTAAPNPDGNQIVSGTDAGELIIWDRRGGDEFGRTVPVHIGDVTAIAVTPDGARVVSVGRDDTMRVTTLAARTSWSMQEVTGIAGAVAVAISPGGTRIFAGGATEPFDYGTSPPVNRLADP